MQGIDKDQYISSFMKKCEPLLNRMARSTYNDSDVASRAYSAIVKGALDNAYSNYVNKGYDGGGIDQFLYRTIRSTTATLYNENKSQVLVCPACKDSGRIEAVKHYDNKLTCDNCFIELRNCSESERPLRETFVSHSASGYRCPDCLRFLPESLGSSVSCPYSGCSFKGELVSLKKMSHPVSKINRISEDVSFTPDNSSFNAIDKISVQENLDRTYKILTVCIDDHIRTLHLKGYPSTYMTRLCIYKAFKSAMDKYPDDAIPYLTYGRRSGTSFKIQAKIFQEFALHLEEAIPFTYEQGGKKIEIKSITDERLKIFSGESVFDAEVNEEGIIPNMTKEMYIGGRSAYYNQPYYIGKLIDVIDTKSNLSILDSVKEHSCIKIHMQKTVAPGTKVQVKHLRIPPHPQMGGFVFLNRLKKTITDRARNRLK